MSNKNKTPLLRPLRKEGGTLYIFPSATEDIGLNINSRANRVALSYYALLDIPNCETYSDIISGQDPEIWVDSEARADSLNKNRFMPGLIPGRFTNTGQDQVDRSETGIGSWEIAASLQNYAMNFETVLRNQDSYNYQLSKTVSERVFWKWLKETGAIRWEYIKDLKSNPDGTEIKKGYYREVSDSDFYTRVVKCFGEISAGNSLSTEFGMFNEIYITVPSSYGESPIYFQIDEDDNYQLGKAYTSLELQNNILEGRKEYINKNIIDFQYTLNKAWSDVYQESPNSVDSTKGTIVTENGLPWYKDLYNNEGDINSYITDDGITDYTKPLDVDLYVTPPGEDSSFIVKRSKLDAVSLIKSIPLYEDIMKSQCTDIITDENSGEFSSLDYPIELIEDGLLTWDTLAIDFHKNIDSKFTFNTVLLYYTVYDANNQTELATNLFGVLFLDGVRDEQGSESSDFSGANMQFSFNEIEKRQSNENGFGTGYSFRVNIKTSSIFDNTDALISDNTTANSIITDNFNDVIYSLRHSLLLMQGNTYTTQTLIDKYNELHAHVQNNDIDIRKLKTDLNTYLMYKYDNIVSTSVDSDTISVRTIVPDSLNTVKSGSSTFESTINFNFYRNNPGTSDYILSDSPIMSIGTHNVDIKHGTVEQLKAQNLYQYIPTPWLATSTDNSDIKMSDPVLDNALTILEAINIKLLQDTNTWITEDWDYETSEWVKTVHDGTEQYYIIDPSSSLFTERNNWGYKSNMIYTDYTSGITWVNYQKFIPLIILTLKKLLTYHKTGVSADTELSSTLEKKFDKWIEKGEETLANVTAEAQEIVNRHSEKLTQYSDIINQNRASIINETANNITADVNTMVERNVSEAVQEIVDSTVPDTLWDFAISEKVSNLVDDKINQRFPSASASAQSINLENMSADLTNLNNAISVLQTTFNSFSNSLSNLNANDSNSAISTIINTATEASIQLESISQYMNKGLPEAEEEHTEPYNPVP